MIHREFADWFRKTTLNNPNATPELINLALGPLDHALRYTAYNVNGFHFKTVARDGGSVTTQNSGVFGTFGTRSYASTQDTEMHEGDIAYYGKLVDIFVLAYNGHRSVPLFKCDWAGTRG